MRITCAGRRSGSGSVERGSSKASSITFGSGRDSVDTETGRDVERCGRVASPVKSSSAVGSRWALDVSSERNRNRAGRSGGVSADWSGSLDSVSA